MRDIIAVIGTTGVGKSQLAISLALTQPPSRSLVLSADSMQLYKGLDVITNKVTKEEQAGVQHWGLDMVQPGEGDSWEVGKWCGEAERVIEALPDDTLPILCGGTHYFIQHFLFPPLNLQFSTERPATATESATASSNVKWTPPCPLPQFLVLAPDFQRLLETFWQSAPIWPSAPIPSSSQQPEEKGGPSRPSVNDPKNLLAQWQLLEMIDPAEAQRWHWKDGRKVKRGIERWWERLAVPTPEPVTLKANTLAKARFRTLIFWVYDSLENLRPRLDARVDRMVKNGLLEEVELLRTVAKEAYGREEGIGHEEGIFQAIGYKEFASVPSPLSSDDPLYAAALERTKISTRQYAKSQLHWIRKQLLPVVRDARNTSDGGEVWVYVVPGGVAGENLACEILKKFQEGSEMPSRSHFGSELVAVLDDAVSEGEGVPDIERRQQLNARRLCAECSESLNEPFSVLAKSWADHIRSKVHARHVSALWKAQDPEGWLAAVIDSSRSKSCRRRERAEDQG